MVFYKAYINSTSVFVKRIKIDNKHELVKELNKASSMDNGQQDLGGHHDVYATTKKEIKEKIKSHYGFYVRQKEITWQDININWTI